MAIHDENVESGSDKGDRTIAVGRLRTRSWVNEAGETLHHRLEADDVALALKFHIVKDIIEPEHSRTANSREHSADALDEPPF